MQNLNDLAQAGARTFAVAAVGLVLVWGTGALAHEWYDPWCCNGEDCKPYPAEKVQVRPNGYYLPEFKAFIPFEQAKLTPMHASEPYHLCEYPKGSGTVRCFYAAEGGS